MMTAMIELERYKRKHYVPDGAVLAAFHSNDSFVRMIRGPLGSGKSACCAVEVLRRASKQLIGRDGVRRSRWAIIRQTYPELKSTTIKTWQQWCDAPVVFGAPITTRVLWDLPDGTRMDLEVFFLAMQHAADVKKVLSLELTGAWLNEVREIPKAVVDGVIGRTMRYPSKAEGGFNYTGVIADTNSPDNDHWYYRLEQKKRPSNWRFFIQPGALLKVTQGTRVFYVDNPAAENVRHQTLGYEYWRNQLPGKDPDWVKVYVLGQYGSIFTGRPVYGDWWNRGLHVSDQPIEPYRGLPLYFGWDFGLTPGVVVFQVTPHGQVRVLREFWCPDGGLKQFCTAQVLPALAREFPDMGRRSWGDPAGQQRSQADSDVTCIKTLNGMGFNCTAAPTNDFAVRRDAVITALSRLVDGQPGLLVDSRCSLLIRGFEGGYQFARVRSEGGEEMFRYVPNKNEFSHIHEALQYGLLGAMTPEGVTSTEAPAVVVQPRETWGGV